MLTCSYALTIVTGRICMGGRKTISSLGANDICFMITLCLFFGRASSSSTLFTFARPDTVRFIPTFTGGLGKDPLVAVADLFNFRRPLTTTGSSATVGKVATVFLLAIRTDFFFPKVKWKSFNWLVLLASNEVFSNISLKPRVVDTRLSILAFGRIPDFTTRSGRKGLRSVGVGVLVSLGVVAVVQHIGDSDPVAMAAGIVSWETREGLLR